MKYRDFSEMPDDKLRAFAYALAAVGRRKSRAAWKEPGDFSPTRSVSTGALDQIGGVAPSPSVPRPHSNTTGGK